MPAPDVRARVACGIQILAASFPYRPVVRSVRVRLCTLTFHGYARLRTLTPQHSARLCTLGLGDTEVDLLYSHAQVPCRKKIGAGAPSRTSLRIASECMTV